MQDVCSEIDHQSPDDGRLSAALFKSAMALVHDPVEARALVALTLEAASESRPRAAKLGDADFFRLLRQAYHSIERSRPRRRMRDALVTSIAAQQEQEPSRVDEGH